MLLDSFKANLTASLKKIIAERRRALVVIPGCITGIVQTCDVSAHAPYSKIYKSKETADAMMQLRRGVAVPTTRRSAVLNRACSSWDDLDHVMCSEGFLVVGVANDLFGADDHKLSHQDAAPFWHELEMPRQRQEIGKRIRAQVEAGEFWNFLEQYTQVLVEYPHDRDEPEGYEAYRWEHSEASDDDGSQTPDDDDEDEEEEEEEEEEEDDDDDDDDEEEEDEEEGDGDDAAEDDADDEGDDDSDTDCDYPGGRGRKDTSGGGGGRSSCVAVKADAARSSRAKGLKLAGVAVMADAAPSSCAKEAKAKADLWSEADERALKATTAALEALRAHGGDRSIEDVLVRRVRALNKKRTAPSKPVAVMLRAKTMERAAQDDKVRKENAKRDHALKMKKLEVRRQENALKVARHAASADRVEMRSRELQLKQQKADEKKAQERAVAKNMEKAKTLAATVAKRIQAHFADEPHYKACSDVVARRIGKHGGQLSAASPPTFFWPVPSICQNISVKVDKSKRPAGSHMASPAFAVVMFGRRSRESLTDPAPQTHFYRLIERLLPRYFELFPYEYRSLNLVTNNCFNYDLAFLEAVWRYSRVLGENHFPCGWFDPAASASVRKRPSSAPALASASGAS